MFQKFPVKLHAIFFIIITVSKLNSCLTDPLFSLLLPFVALFWSNQSG
jgi:hypothetical protein